MRFNLEHTPLRLDHGVLLKIRAGQGRALRVVEGRVWVTQEGSLDDLFLEAGETCRLESPGSTVVTAEGRVDAVTTVAFDTPLSVHERGILGRRWFGLIGHRDAS